MNHLLEKIKQKNASAFTHSGKFHADDVFSAALLLYLNPEITITRGNQVPENYEGLVFDIGRGQYDHHQKDSHIRDNGVPYAAFGLLWEKLGPEILGEELALKFDESFVQPLDINDNTGEKNELARQTGGRNSYRTCCFPRFGRYPGRKYQYPYTSGIYSLPKAPFGNQHCFCDLSVQPGRLLYPATEKRIFHELQMQFSFFLAGPGRRGVVFGNRS